MRLHLSGSGASLRRAVASIGSDAWLAAAGLAALALLSFIGGSVATTAGVTPGPQIARAYAGGKALVERLTRYDDVYASDLWHEARTDGQGVTVHLRGRPAPGYTVYTSGDRAAAMLIDLDGHVLHEWHKPYSEVWQAGLSSVKRPQPDSHVYFRKALPLPDGSLIALYEGVGDTPYGYGLVKLDRDSRVVWRFLENAHHDFSVAPDGRIAVLTQRIVDHPDPVDDQLATPRLEDWIVLLSPRGEKLDEMRLLPLVQRSSYHALLYTVSSYSLADPLHANSVHVITEDEARQFSFGRAGQLLVSFRELGAVGVIDPARRQLVWARRGYWIGQHDPNIVAGGHLLMFDNRGDFDGPRSHSRAIEVDPRTMAITWQYGGTPQRPLDSDIRSQVQRLDNGNTLIVESNGGRVFEVTHDGQVVWAFANPVRAGPDGNLIPIVANAQRLSARDLSWLSGSAPTTQEDPRQ